MAIEITSKIPEKVSAMTITTQLVDSFYAFDGDTLSVKINGQQMKLRAKWIDCPETQKPGIPETEANLNQWSWGIKAKSHLLSILENQKLSVAICEKDMYGRNLADWYIGKPCIKNNVQVMMIAAGLATDLLPFRKFDLSDSDHELYMAIVKNQHKAWKDKLGIWSDENFQIPSEYRKANLGKTEKSV
jgi:endonuclease YncB( thermonuclease family)